MAEGDAPAEPIEVEVKYGVRDPGPIRALIDDPDPNLLAEFRPIDAGHVEVVTDRYVDTDLATGLLYASGMRARVRESTSGFVLAVKRRGVVSAVGVTSRAELEGPASATLDPASWPASAARSLLLATIGAKPLVEIAALRQTRLVRRFGRDGAVVEVSLDEIAALDGEDEIDDRVELEAELKAGPVDALTELAAALDVVDGLGFPLGSKLQFALEARGLGAVRPIGGSPNGTIGLLDSRAQ